jgi:hypothetical protein
LAAVVLIFAGGGMVLYNPLKTILWTPGQKNRWKGQVTGLQAIIFTALQRFASGQEKA